MRGCEYPEYLRACDGDCMKCSILYTPDFDDDDYDDGSYGDCRDCEQYYLENPNCRDCINS